MNALRSLRPESSTLRQIEFGVFIVLMVAITLRVWFQPPSALEQTLFQEELQVALMERTLGHSEMSVTTGHDQLELELLHGFADHLGARLRIHRSDDIRTIDGLLRGHRVDLAAGLLTHPGEVAGIEPGPEILKVQHVLAYWHDDRNDAPESSPEGRLSDARIGVSGFRPLPASLVAREQNPPTVTPVGSLAPSSRGTDPGDTSHDAPDRSEGPAEPISFPNAAALRTALEHGEIDFALMNSLEYRRMQRLHPSLRIAQRLEGEASVVWLFPSGFDASLIEAARDYLDGLRESRTLDTLVDRYLGHLEVHDLVDTLTFARQVENRLDRFRPLFEAAGEQFNLDWRFIAAVAYQESHWDPDAISPTGVRGLMMLTRSTADGLGIGDRTDSEASIEGGARYLADLRERVSARIPEPDRTWMALAAYNVGLGHVNDARRLAEANGDDPDRWLDVMEWLPRLAVREWHEQTRFGYARGREPVTYVQNIRSYYDKLVQRFPEPGDRRRPLPALYRETPLAL
ncbi:MAG: membrane-bound lytic murein transglycosylase MltF [Pseudomonadota bacterium]